LRSSSTSSPDKDIREHAQPCSTTYTPHNAITIKPSILLSSAGTDTEDTSAVTPERHESSSIEVEDKTWTNEELMDDGRPGRRGGVLPKVQHSRKDPEYSQCVRVERTKPDEEEADGECLQHPSDDALEQGETGNAAEGRVQRVKLWYRVPEDEPSASPGVSVAHK
jgi:hypothetical protein